MPQPPPPLLLLLQHPAGQGSLTFRRRWIITYTTLSQVMARKASVGATFLTSAMMAVRLISSNGS